MAEQGNNGKKAGSMHFGKMRKFPATRHTARQARIIPTDSSLPPIRQTPLRPARPRPPQTIFVAAATNIVWGAGWISAVCSAWAVGDRMLFYRGSRFSGSPLFSCGGGWKGTRDFMRRPVGVGSWMVFGAMERVWVLPADVSFTVLRFRGDAVQFDDAAVEVGDDACSRIAGEDRPAADEGFESPIVVSQFEAVCRPSAGCW